MNTVPEFGIKRENEERRDGGCAVVFDPKSKLFAVGRQTKDGLFRLFSGGVDAKEDIKEGVMREVIEESGLHDFIYVEKLAEALTHYHNNLRNVNRVAHATCFLIVLRSSEVNDVELEEHEKFELDWAAADEIISNWESRNEHHDYDHWIYFMKIALTRLKELGHEYR
jgi:ADP-ribose pyrophosphatase YjhB (NUDIX family)